MGCPRNRNIASVFYKAGFIETWGRGYKKIREEFAKVGLPAPTVEEQGGGVLVTIPRKTGNGGLNVPLNGDAPLKSVQRYEMICSLMRQTPQITLMEISKQLNIAQRTLKRDIANMQKQHIISRQGSDKTGTWLVLDPKGSGTDSSTK